MKQNKLKNTMYGNADLIIKLKYYLDFGKLATLLQ